MTIYPARLIGEAPWPLSEPVRTNGRYSCQRCGIRRPNRLDRPGTLCRDCIEVLALEGKS